MKKSARKNRNVQKLNLPEGSSTEAHIKFAGKKFHPHDLASFIPSTKQKDFVHAFHSGFQIIAQFGSAGTGKTAAALYFALQEVFDPSSPYDKVVIVRSAVQARDIGFLPGSEGEKDAPYEAPYQGLCDEYITAARSRNYENLKSIGMLEFYNTSFLRGRTFSRAIIIVDEVQSMTYHEASTVITRMGDNCRMILCGDSKQSDLHRRNDKTCFFDLRMVLGRMTSAAMIEYTTDDIVRSGIVRDFLEAEVAAGLA